MRIPTREEQARYGSLNAHDTQRFNVQERTPNASLQINADMFGAGQARAMGEGARALQYGARQVAHWYRENELTKATETFTKYQESLNDDLYGENGIFTSKGEAALDAPKRANDLLKKRAEEFSKNAGNDLGQEFFMQKAAGFNQQLMPRATLHAENERNSWMIATHSAAANNAINEAVKNYSNPDVFNQLMGEAAMNAALAAQKQGLPPEAVKMKRDKAVSDGYMLVGQGLLAAGDIKGAMGILESGRLDGQDGIRFKANINQEQKRLQAEARANAAEATYNKAETLANGLYGSVENGELSNAEALLQIRNIKDPKLQAHARSSYMQRLQIAEISRKETVARGYEKGADDFDRTGNNMQEQYDLVQNASRAALLPGATEEQKSYARSLKEQYKMSTQFAEDGIRTGSNPAAYDAVTNLVYGGADVSDLKKTEYWSQLSPTAKRTFEKSVKEGQQASLSELTRLYNESYRTAEGTEYTAKNGNGDREIFIQRSLEKIRDTKRGNEPKYLQSLVDEHFMEATNPGGKIWDTSGKYGQLSRTEGGALPIMSEADRQQVEVVFNSNPQVKKAWMDYAKKTWGEANANYAMRAYLLQQKLKITGKRGQ